jgi:hypothetical protein
MNALYKLMLRGSVVSALALLTAAVGCSDTDKEDETGAGGEPAGKAGSSSTAGSSSNPGGAGGDAPTPTAGTAGAGGAEGGAGPTGTTEGGAAGAGGAGSDRPEIVFSAGGDGAGGASDVPTVAKFCNSLTFVVDGEEADTTMVLEVGEGADKVTFTALSGTCAPADGAECKAIPHGADVPVTLFDADDLDTALDEGFIKSRGGASWIFYTDLTEGASPSPIVGGAPIDSPACEDVIWEDVF